ncbi:MAG: TIGR02757 family protein [Cyclobacteriaceae bacterium]|nr:TIGR02757 family protein [Cyclobacteriaceae bacterium]
MTRRKLTNTDIKLFLNEKVLAYNQPGFIANDPVSIPHLFIRRQDIEIAGLFAATLAWGQRITIINNCRKLLSWMDNDPYNFILHHKEKDLKPFVDFRHRTFNGTDALYFIDFLKRFYVGHDSLEEAFRVDTADATIAKGLINFRNLFFSSPDYPLRTKKHIATPERKSACKRLNMYLRWMVRHDNQGVDFGIWKNIKPAQLVCPCDVHVERVARKLGLIKRKQMDWLTALELTDNLRKLDPVDPVKYDFALFGLGLEKF